MRRLHSFHFISRWGTVLGLLWLLATAAPAGPEFQGIFSNPHCQKEMEWLGEVFEDAYRAEAARLGIKPAEVPEYVNRRIRVEYLTRDMKDASTEATLISDIMEDFGKLEKLGKLSDQDWTEQGRLLARELGKNWVEGERTIEETFPFLIQGLNRRPPRNAQERQTFIDLARMRTLLRMNRALVSEALKNIPEYGKALADIDPNKRVSAAAAALSNILTTQSKKPSALVQKVVKNKFAMLLQDRDMEKEISPKIARFLAAPEIPLESKNEVRREQDFLQKVGLPPSIELEMFLEMSAQYYGVVLR